jgi:hypothetical protein
MSRTGIVLGLTGLPGVGKDTLATVFCEYNFKRASFADALYEEAAAAFRVSVGFLQHRPTKETPLAELSLALCDDTAFKEAVFGVLLTHGENPATILTRPRAPRKILQWWGTEYRRADNDRYWLEKVERQIVQEPDTNFVITDVRFIGEADAVKAMGGQLIRVHRQVVEDAWHLAQQDAATAAHSSDTEMAEYPVDHAFINVEGAAMAGLEEQVVAYMRQLKDKSFAVEAKVA